jgi:arylsulfatase A-like enzyme/Flp pilus assembly protein TadD
MRKILITVVLLLPSAAACAPQQTRITERRPVPVNVILITMDTLRADHLGCYGATQVQTPSLDALCSESIVFDRAFSQVPLTWPSHAAILTGTYPFQNQVQDFTGQPLSAQFRSIAQAFKRQGYTTGAVVSAFVLDRSWGLSRGFDFYDDTFSAEEFQKKDIGLVDRRASESVNLAIGWLEKTSHRPFFLWLHLYDPHSPYDPPEPYRSQYQGRLYDGEVAYADNELGRLFAWLKQHRLYNSSVIVFLSDHGESLGEHGEQEHGFFVYNATVHIPLILKPPKDTRFQPKRIDAPVEAVAVAPTLAEIAGLKDPIQKQFQAPGLLGSTTEDTSSAYSETFYPFSSFGWSPLHALETSRFHYIDAPTPELYDVVNDPGETNNLASQQPAMVAVLKDKLDQRLKNNPFTQIRSTNLRISPDALDRLRALGYVGYRAPVSAEVMAAGLPDPKTKLWEFNAILRAGDAFRVNDFATGETLLAKVRELDPTTHAVAYMLGEAALRQQLWDRAATELQNALKADPDFDQAMTALARALHEKGDDAGARTWLQKALAQNAQNFRAWYELGWLEDQAGNRVSAERAYQKVLSIQPNFALAHRDLGLVYFKAKDYAKALPHLSRAAKLGLKEAQLFNLLGICYSRTGQLSEAVSSYRQALGLQPSLAEAHLNLGFAYAQLRKVELSSHEYQEACRLNSELCGLIPPQK